MKRKDIHKIVKKNLEKLVDFFLSLPVLLTRGWLRGTIWTFLQWRSWMRANHYWLWTRTMEIRVNMSDKKTIVWIMRTMSTRNRFQRVHAYPRYETREYPWFGEFIRFNGLWLFRARVLCISVKLAVRKDVLKFLAPVAHGHRNVKIGKQFLELANGLCVCRYLCHFVRPPTYEPYAFRLLTLLTSTETS